MYNKQMIIIMWNKRGMERLYTCAKWTYYIYARTNWAVLYIWLRLRKVELGKLPKAGTATGEKPTDALLWDYARAGKTLVSKQLGLQIFP